MLWTAMVGLYYVLARDEERRMVAAFADPYRSYMSRTGMFLPRAMEDVLARIPGPRSPALRAPLVLALILALTVGSAFALRSYTVARLPLWSNGRVSVLAVLPGDAIMLQHRMEDVLQMPEVESRLAVLGYIVPTQYVMQGMIADTDPAYRLYEHHQTMAMIADWIFHPFRHLEGGHAMIHHATAGAAAAASPGVRRIIFLRVATNGGVSELSSLFAIGAVRLPQFLVDVDMHSLTLLDVRDSRAGDGVGPRPHADVLIPCRPGWRVAACVQSSAGPPLRGRADPPGPSGTTPSGTPDARRPVVE